MMRARRWVKGLLLVMAVLVLAAAGSGAAYEFVARSQARSHFAPPGVMVTVDGSRRMQMDCRGSGSPTVVLESGLDNYGSLAWAAVHDSMARTTRVCAYSRAGIMWSDPAPGAFDAQRAARDLHAALLAAGARPPWIIVGHSIGGAYAVVFAHAFAPEVSGVVLVDATHPDQFSRYERALGKSLRPVPGILRLGAALAWTGLVRALPVPPTPLAWPRAVGTVSPSFLSTSLGALVRETQAIPATLDYVRAAHSLGARPVVVLTAMRAHSDAELREMGLTREQGVLLSGVWRELHEDAAAWSTQGRHEIIDDASHYIQFDRPDVVIRAVREVVGQVRALRE